MKKSKVALTLLLCLLVVSFGAITSEAAFEQARKPMTNPVYFDLAVPTTYIHPLYAYHTLPDEVSTTIGDVPVDGDVQVYALRIEYALNERWSLLAAKDGYIDIDPDDTLAEEDGWGDIAVGAKWAFLYDPDNQMAASVKLLFEFASGDEDVFQGNGDGTVTPAIDFLKLWGGWQFAASAGLTIPFDDDKESAMFYDSWHVSYALTEKLFPMIELNHWYVVSEGDGEADFDEQGGNLVPSIVTFEGGDLFNLGSEHGDDDETIVTLGLGLRYRLMETLDLGASFEFPLTDDEENLMDTRTTVDLVWRF
ncbi:MAG: transporter [Thermodesulfobacteriota bacterium]|nr:transporter [Thermodesulfobacteriota bacterium]